MEQAERSEQPPTASLTVDALDFFHLILKLSHLCILHTHRGRGCNLLARK